MQEHLSKTTFLYGTLRLVLQSGRYLPGDRINTAALARAFKTSPTPVRFALFRLAGERLIIMRVRGGFQLPHLHLTETRLLEHYAWMEWLLLTALELGLPLQDDTPSLKVPQPDSDIAMATRELFEAIALATGNDPVHHAVRKANDRLWFVRRIEQDLVKNTSSELVTLVRHWQRRDIKALTSAITHYHDRRKLLVPRLVALTRTVTRRASA